MWEAGATQVVNSDGYRYSDAPVEARIGKHLYRIPANYFYDQMGPTFQGDVSLRLQWPDLTPMPPGQTRRQTMGEFMAAVNYDIYYVDRIDIRESTRRAYMNGEPSDSLAYRDPERRLDLRVPQREAWGLVRYDLDPELAREYAEAYEALHGYPHAPTLGARQDWYVARDQAGDVVTFIRCDTSEKTDGLIVREGKLLDSQDPKDRVAQCDHMMVFPEESLRVSISYVRVVLSDWQRIEAALRDLLISTRVK